MTEEQYNFSNKFWSDDDWDITDKLPKKSIIDDDGNIIFIYLSKKEMKNFIKMKLKKENNNKLIAYKLKKIYKI